jgi:transaldolase/glucose-6-phosphate isomerase
MTKLHELAELGQAVWLDYIRRSFIVSGDLQALVDDGLRGVTSNPSIFEKAIAGSTDYDQHLQRLVEKGRTVEEIYEALTLDDIRRAADVLRPVYDATDCSDGYVSLEVSPTLAQDTGGTVAEAQRLFKALDRPNVMIKVPATREGIPAIERLIGEGINVNVTLMFSLAHYDAVAKAYLAGLEKLMMAGGDLSRVASVASFFVSRVDRVVDPQLEAVGNAELQGKIAVANAKLAYARFRETFSGKRWERLAAEGARVQRPLWASTSTKNPLYSDVLYVDSLIGPHTVNTMPPQTLNAFRDHGTAAVTVDKELDEARAHIDQLAELGIDLDAITENLQDDGVTAFVKSFEGLMASITEKRERLLVGWQHSTATLGTYQPAVDAALAQMAKQKITARIWTHDHTVWQPDPSEITNRLGWLHIAEAMLETVPRLHELAEEARATGYTHALLLGMGGSSLAPQVFRNTFGVKEGHLDLAVLDSTDPGAVLAHADRLDLSRSLFIVATKSGGTAETLSFFKFFYNRVAEAVGADHAGEHFVAITDPGTQLVDLAKRYHFRATFLNDPNIGGRYSALSCFGLVPAALIGANAKLLLERAQETDAACASCLADTENRGAWLGTIMGVLANLGRDKLTLVTTPAIASFGNWVEQLIAESTGKDGKGILPVVGEPLAGPLAYGDDRLFVALELAGEELDQEALAVLEYIGHPVVRLYLRDLYDLGQQVLLWEMATAVAGYHLGINPFDQPNVESAKVLAREAIAAYMEKGALPRADSVPLTAGALLGFLDQAQPGDYVSLQAYVTPTADADVALRELRTRLRDHLKLATTSGYGPRFLHSAGQLHKGDAGNGLFIQLTADDARDAAIPDEAGSTESTMTFGVLKEAQVQGDYQALRRAGRRVLRFHLGDDVIAGLRALADALE